MQAKIKYVKLLEQNGDYGFEISLMTEEGIKKFGKITDKLSFRRLFFGILSMCNNYDVAELSGSKGKKISVIIENPNSLNQRIAAVGNKSKFLLDDKGDKYITKKLNYKEMKLLKMVDAIQTGKIIDIKSSSGTICMLFEFKVYSQGATGPSLYVGMGYPLNNTILKEDVQEFVANYSSSYIAGLIKTILNTKYLYHEKRNKKEYIVECFLDEQGDIVSIGNKVELERREIPLYINKYADEYRLEANPLQIKKEDKKTLNRK